MILSPSLFQCYDCVTSQYPIVSIDKIDKINQPFKITARQSPLALKLSINLIFKELKIMIVFDKQNYPFTPQVTRRNLPSTGGESVTR